MKKKKLYINQYSTTQSSTGKKMLDVGLYFNNTGQPIFLLATTSPVSPKPVLIENMSQFYDIIPDKNSFLNNLAYNFMNAYFKLGGKQAVVLPVTVKNYKRECSDEFYRECLGDDNGQLVRSGVQVLKNYPSLGDVLLAPQAPVVLKEKQLQSFYQKMGHLVEKLPLMILLVDVPNLSSFKWLEKFCSKVLSEDIALLYPWCTTDEEGLLPPSVVVASQIYRLDKQSGIANPLANQSLVKGFSQVRTFSNDEVRELNDLRINVIRDLSQDKVIWGNFTSSEAPISLSTRRVLKSIQDGLVRISEPFFMEARDESTALLLRENLEAFLDSLSEKGVLFSDSESKGYTIECYLTRAQQKNTDDIIEVEISLSIDRRDQSILIPVTDPQLAQLKT